MLNMVKGPNFEVNTRKMLPASQKLKLQSALNAPFAVLPLLPPCDDIRLFVHGHNGHPLVAFVAKVVYVVHSHISDRIFAQTYRPTKPFEKFPFHVKNEKKK